VLVAELHDTSPLPKINRRLSRGNPSLESVTGVVGEIPASHPATALGHSGPFDISNSLQSGGIGGNHSVRPRLDVVLKAAAHHDLHTKGLFPDSKRADAILRQSSYKGQHPAVADHSSGSNGTAMATASSSSSRSSSSSSLAFPSSASRTAAEFNSTHHGGSAGNSPDVQLSGQSSMYRRTTLHRLVAKVAAASCDGRTGVFGSILHNNMIVPAPPRLVGPHHCLPTLADVVLSLPHSLFLSAVKLGL